MAASRAKAMSITHWRHLYKLLPLLIHLRSKLLEQTDVSEMEKPISERAKAQSEVFSSFFGAASLGYILKKAWKETLLKDGQGSRQGFKTMSLVLEATEHVIEDLEVTHDHDSTGDAEKAKAKAKQVKAS